MLKAKPLRSTRGAAKIIINNDYVLPTKRMRTVLEAILAASTFRIVGELTWCRLSHVHISSPRQVLSPDFVHCFLPFDRCVSDALVDEKLEEVYDFGAQCSIDLVCSISALCQRE